VCPPRAKTLAFCQKSYNPNYLGARLGHCEDALIRMRYGMDVKRADLEVIENQGAPTRTCVVSFHR
jgi:hypothetical protein